MRRRVAARRHGGGWRRAHRPPGVPHAAEREGGVEAARRKVLGRRRRVGVAVRAVVVDRRARVVALDDAADHRRLVGGPAALAEREREPRAVHEVVGDVPARVDGERRAAAAVAAAAAAAAQVDRHRLPLPPVGDRDVEREREAAVVRLPRRHVVRDVGRAAVARVLRGRRPRLRDLQPARRRRRAEQEDDRTSGHACPPRSDGIATSVSPAAPQRSSRAGCHVAVARAGAAHEEAVEALEAQRRAAAADRRRRRLVDRGQRVAPLVGRVVAPRRHRRVGSDGGHGEAEGARAAGGRPRDGGHEARPQNSGAGSR